MGDRVLIQVVKHDGKEIEFSPVAYGHWAGGMAPAVVARLQARMKDRPGDVDYTFARLVQEMCGNDDGSTGFGCWNASAILESKDSHGDAGVILIDVSGGGFKCECKGGYLLTGADGLPRESEAA